MNIKDNYSLIVFGDSISKGVVYDTEKSRYSTLKENFASIVGNNLKGTVYNAGKFGSTILRGINKMYNDVLKKTPDIVLIEFGGNDCDFNWDDVALNPNTEHSPNTEISTFREKLLEMITTFKNANIIPALMTLPPLDPTKYFSWVSKGNPESEKNILKWLGSKEAIFSWHNSYNEMISSVARETGTVLIDVRSEFLKYKDYSKFLCMDGIHPNKEGHSVIASVVLNFIEKNYNFLLQR
jgi:lysophospholipase L1-like esterase